MRFCVHVGTSLPAHTTHLLYWCAGWFWNKNKQINGNTQRIMTVVVWWKYNNTETWLQAARTNEKWAIIAELLMPMMQPTMTQCVQPDRVTVDIWSKIRIRYKIRSLFCNALSTFAIIKAAYLQLCNCCIVAAIVLCLWWIGLWSVIVVFTGGHPHLHSDKTVRMYR